MHFDTLNRQRFSRFKITNVKQSSQIKPTRCLIVGSAGHVDRQAIFSLVDPCTGDVIVGDDHGMHGSDVATMLGHSFFSLFAIDARIKKKTNTAGFHLKSVAVGTGL